jgi:hypothetical protein
MRLSISKGTTNADAMPTPYGFGLGLMLLLFALRQSDIAQLFQPLRGAIGQIRKSAGAKQGHLGNHQIPPLTVRGVDRPCEKIGCTAKARASLSPLG